MPWSLQFLVYLRTLSLKFQKATYKQNWEDRAETGKLQFWSKPSEILNLKSSNMQKCHTPLWSQTLVRSLLYIYLWQKSHIFLWKTQNVRQNLSFPKFRGFLKCHNLDTYDFYLVGSCLNNENNICTVPGKSWEFFFELPTKGLTFLLSWNPFFVKFRYSEKATKFCEISTLDLTLTTYCQI